MPSQMTSYLDLLLSGTGVLTPGAPAMSPRLLKDIAAGVGMPVSSLKRLLASGGAERGASGILRRILGGGPSVEALGMSRAMGGYGASWGTGAAMPPGYAAYGGVPAAAGAPAMSAAAAARPVPSFDPAAVGAGAQIGRGVAAAQAGRWLGGGGKVSRALRGLGTKLKAPTGRLMGLPPGLTSIALLIGLPLIAQMFQKGIFPGPGREREQIQHQAGLMGMQMSAQAAAQPSGQSLVMQALLPAAAQTMQQALGQAMGAGAEFELPEVRWE